MKNVLESLKESGKSGKITIREAAIKLHKAGWTSFVDVDKTKQLLENYTTYTTKLGRKRVRMYQYDYRTESGELFACCAPTLEACRERRDKWLDAKNKSVC